MRFYLGITFFLFSLPARSEWGSESWGSMVWGQTSANVPMMGTYGQLIFFVALLSIGMIISKRWGVIRTLPAVAALMLIPLMADANNIQLNTFQNGEVADADDVNENFQALSSAISNINCALPSDVACPSVESINGILYNSGFTSGAASVDITTDNQASFDSGYSSGVSSVDITQDNAAVCTNSGGSYNGSTDTCNDIVPSSQISSVCGEGTSYVDAVSYEYNELFGISCNVGQGIDSGFTGLGSVTENDILNNETSAVCQQYCSNDPNCNYFKDQAQGVDPGMLEFIGDYACVGYTNCVSYNSSGSSVFEKGSLVSGSNGDLGSCVSIVDITTDNQASYDSGYQAGVNSVDITTDNQASYNSGYTAGANSVDITADNQASYDSGYNAGVSSVDITVDNEGICTNAGGTWLNGQCQPSQTAEYDCFAGGFCSNNSYANPNSYAGDTKPASCSSSEWNTGNYMNSVPQAMGILSAYICD